MSTKALTVSMIILLGLLLVGCQTSSSSPHVYLAPIGSLEEDTRIDCRDHMLSFTTIVDSEQFMDFISEDTESLWIHTSRLDEIDSIWLHEHYLQGKMVVLVGDKAGEYLASIVDPTGVTANYGEPGDNLAAGRRFPNSGHKTYTRLMDQDATMALCSVVASLNPEQ